MLRVLGFIVGGTLTALVLLDYEPQEVVQRGKTLTTDAVQWVQTVTESPAPASSDAEPITRTPAPAGAADGPAQLAPETDPATMNSAAGSAGAIEPGVPGAALEDPEDPDYPAPQPVVMQPPDSGWQPLWQPFRSELSARGFAGQITEITGRQTRVRRLGPRSHQVDVAFADEAERRDLLLRLELLTGIELREEGS